MLAKESLKDLIAVRGRQVSVENIQNALEDETLDERVSKTLSKFLDKINSLDGEEMNEGDLNDAIIHIAELKEQFQNH